MSVALLAAQGQVALAEGSGPGPVERGLQRLADEGPSYARRDAAFALADLCWRTGRRDEAAERYRELASQSRQRGGPQVLPAPHAALGYARIGPPARP